ncbi:SDR family NAD(P)-dependent oxidoreductase [Enterovibrio coralii]|uniref:Short-chain dehydrogenase n=1 Tax=Enterovibrio coralii TaxID=294935 RepID=A0A135I8X7_9GAMM|nr:SDR family NAD(P)-dependent oxidoreductase [Enterovibrio coralii]KXF81901.1 short-chain dehydrogenase [Enterovibrio coralii]
MHIAKDKPLAVIAGYGEGLGEALKHCFEEDGYHVITLSRRKSDILADTTNAQEVNDAFDRIQREYGTPDVVVCNTALLTIDGFLTTTAERFENTWRASVLSTFNIAQAVLPAMLSAGKGSLLVTGATAGIRGSKNFSAFSSAKFALRGLVQSLAREFQPKNIHIAHIIIDGILWSQKSRERFPALVEENAIQPQDAANMYLFLAKQPKSAWTQEIDIRPYNETF